MNQLPLYNQKSPLPLNHILDFINFLKWVSITNLQSESISWWRVLTRDFSSFKQGFYYDEAQKQGFYYQNGFYYDGFYYDNGNHGKAADGFYYDNGFYYDGFYYDQKQQKQGKLLKLKIESNLYQRILLRWILLRSAGRVQQGQQGLLVQGRGQGANARSHQWNQNHGWPLRLPEPGHRSRKEGILKL